MSDPEFTALVFVILAARAMSQRMALLAAAIMLTLYVAYKAGWIT